jgi:hypothetical protein
MNKEELLWLNGETNNMVVGFTTMVKKGEVYTSCDPVLSDKSEGVQPVLLGRSDRPRQICVPPEANTGTGVYLQQLIFPGLKKVLPGFS